MKTQKIKRNDLQKLHKIACEGWQKRIAEIALFQSGEELEVENNQILEAYSQANSEQKKLIEKFFKIIENDLFSVKSYSEVCKRLNVAELTVKDFISYGEDAKKMFRFHQIKNLEKFYNDGWVKDWKNQGQYKYYPYFTINSSGGLGFFDVGYCNSGCVGFVGFFKDEKTAKFVGQNYIEIYQDLM